MALLCTLVLVFGVIVCVGGGGLGESRLYSYSAFESFLYFFLIFCSYFSFENSLGPVFNFFMLLIIDFVYCSMYIYLPWLQANKVCRLFYNWLLKSSKLERSSGREKTSFYTSRWKYSNVRLVLWMIYQYLHTQKKTVVTSKTSSFINFISLVFISEKSIAMSSST